MSKAKEIPRPQGHPVIGNLLDIDGKAPIQGFMRMARAFGPIFKVTLGGRDVIWVGSQELVDEVSDEARFEKLIHATLYNIRDFAGDGLFTARTDEPNWGKAHRLLRPAFGPLGMRNMFDQMQDVAEQMMLRWERFGPDTAIDVADNMTRLTLDTIALCAFDYRFNSFYQNEMHPFVDAMVGALGEAGARSRRPQIATRAMMLSERRYRDEIRLMHEVADELIARRRTDPDAAGRKDLLSVMLDGRDPQTGERLDDENIRYQMVTFLIAGHETTSGLLSFATYFLLRNPDALARARAEVDAALGNEMPTIETIGKLRYLEQILMETLRIWPTAPAIGLRAKVDTTVGGYPVARDTPIMVLIPTLHRDPKVWGDDVESFRPERFESDAAAKLPPNAW
ncbi:MAG: cytochrome P450, partial [Gemmatimonadales bacterium]|nr:cytochrome P450 [Gemmatimonadales bacterium]